MEDFYLFFDSFNHTNDVFEYYEYDYGNYTPFEEFDFSSVDSLETVWPFVSLMISWIVVWMGFPLTMLAIYALYSLVRDDHVAPVFVINLLISDLIQMCCFVGWVACHRRCMALSISMFIYYFGLMASVGFMVCVALERYLVVACPLWYRFRRKIKFSVLVSILVWALCFIELLIAVLTAINLVIVRFIIFLLPFPLLIFFSSGTLKVLSAATSVHLKEKLRIVVTLVLVLLKYTLIFLPFVIWLLHKSCQCLPHVAHVSYLYLSFLQFSPLVDLVLYIFMRKGTVDRLLAPLCCCRMMRGKEQGQVLAMNEKATEEICTRGEPPGQASNAVFDQLKTINENDEMEVI